MGQADPCWPLGWPQRDGGTNYQGLRLHDSVVSIEGCGGNHSRGGKGLTSGLHLGELGAKAAPAIGREARKTGGLEVQAVVLHPNGPDTAARERRLQDLGSIVINPAAAGRGRTPHAQKEWGEKWGQRRSGRGRPRRGLDPGQREQPRDQPLGELDACIGRPKGRDRAISGVVEEHSISNHVEGGGLSLNLAGIINALRNEELGRGAIRAHYIRHGAEVERLTTPARRLLANWARRKARVAYPDAHTAWQRRGHRSASRV